jgi:hypothetical protein
LVRLQAGAARSTLDNKEFPEMTAAILLGGPLSIVIGCLFWVLSLSNEQAKVNAEVWAQHGVEA